jgi:hopanoid biosynthesis associated RND transporter like protein HpnN
LARRWPLAIIAGWCVLALISVVVVVSGIAINTDSSDMISPKAPYRVAAAKVNEAFPDLGDQLVVLVESETPDEADAFAAALAARLEGRGEVKSLLAAPAHPFFRQNGLLFLEIEELEDLLAKLTNAAPLIERLGPDPELATLFDALADAAESEGVSADQETLDALYGGLARVFTDDDAVLSWMGLLSTGEPPEDRVLISLDPVLDYTKLKPAKAVKQAILEEAEVVRAAEGLEAEVLVTGDPVLRTEELETVSGGVGWALGLSALLVAGLLYVAFRSAKLVFACLLAITLSVILTAGIAVALFSELNLISVAFAVLMVGLGADFSIHLLIHLQHKHRQKTAPRAARYRTVRMIGTALALTAPTTALAFFSFVPTAFIGMNQLGIIAGLGVLIAFLIAMTLIPAIVADPPAGREPKPLFGEAFAKRARPLGLVVLLLGVISFFLLPQARFDADPMALRAKNAPSVIAFNRIADDERASPYRLNLIAGDEETLLDKASLFGGAETVDSTRHLFSFVPDEQDLKLTLIDAAAVGLGFAVISGGTIPPEFDEALARLKVSLSGEEGEAAGALLSVLTQQSQAELEAAAPRVFRFWPQQRARLADQLQAGFVSIDDVPEVLKGRYLSPEGAYRLEILPAGGAAGVSDRRRFVGEVLALDPDAAGAARSALAAGDIIGRSMVQASLTAAVLVALLLFAVTRSVKVLVLLIVPLVLAGSLTTATGTLFGLPYNFANVLVLPLIIGIGIDSGIHLAFRAAATGRPLEAVQGPTGRAVLFSALTTIASFGSLAVSEHRGTASMGLLLTIGMAWTLAVMLLVLPPLAQLLYGQRRQPVRRTP